VIMRWLHITSVVVLIGGCLYGALGIASARALAPEAAETLFEKVAHSVRPLVWTAMALLLISGAYNVLTAPGHQPRYLVLLGVKLLLVMHVFAAGLLALRPNNPRRARQLTGAFMSGLLIILISAYLRRIF